ncbi:MAG: ABC transporter ATP-binding protein [Anaerolineae bacterium]
MMSNIVLETRGLTKRYGRTTVVDAIDITAFEGEIFGFLGPNGAGKTTTLGMALGLVHPTAGEVRIFGKCITPDRVDGLREVGALLGAPAYVPYLSAWDNLDLVGRLSPGVDRRRIAEVLSLVGLADAAKRRVGKFSTGMKQRLGLAMALLHRPRCVLLDEPMNGLDPAGMREIRTLLRSLIEQGTSVLLSSHLLYEVQQVCDRIAVLSKGRIVAQGRVQELLETGKPFVRLTVQDAAAASGMIRGFAGVEDVRCNGSRSLVVKGLSSQALMDELLKHHIIPSEIVAQRGDLEALFIALTEE